MRRAKATHEPATYTDLSQALGAFEQLPEPQKSFVTGLGYGLLLRAEQESTENKETA